VCWQARSLFSNYKELNMKKQAIALQEQKNDMLKAIYDLNIDMLDDLKQEEKPESYFRFIAEKLKRDIQDLSDFMPVDESKLKEVVVYGMKFKLSKMSTTKSGKEYFSWQAYTKTRNGRIQISLGKSPILAETKIKDWIENNLTVIAINPENNGVPFLDVIREENDVPEAINTITAFENNFERCIVKKEDWKKIFLPYCEKIEGWDGVEDNNTPIISIGDPDNDDFADEDTLKFF
jgi:hypothetical protein